MKASPIHFAVFCLTVFITFFAGEISHANEDIKANPTSDNIPSEEGSSQSWSEQGLFLSRYIEENQLVVNEKATSDYFAILDTVSGEERLDLLYYLVLDATFYVYEDIMKTAKPQYIVEIKKQKSTEHQKYLQIMEIFSEFYIGGYSQEAVTRLRLIAENESLGLKARARAYMMLGYAYGVLRETEDIIDALKQLKSILGVSEIDPYFQTEILEFEGFAHMISNDYVKAMHLMHKRVKLAHDLDLLISGDSYVYHVARIMMEKGETSDLFEINEINRRVAEMTGKTRSMFNAAYLCGVNYLRLSTGENALECLSRAEKYLTSAPDRAVHLDYYLTIAHARNNNAAKARFYYDRMTAHPKFEGITTIQKDLPMAQAELLHAEGNYKKAFALQRDYNNQIQIRHTNEIGDVANKLREYAEEQSVIQNERSTLMKLNSTLKDEVISKQRIATYASVGIALIAIFFSLGLLRFAKKLKRARIDAEAANKSKSEFLAKMSHEIRTPMNGILGMTEVLLNSTLSKKQRSYANTVYKSGASLMGILNDILDFSKIEAGKMELDPIPFDLEVAVVDVMTLMERTARDKNLDCEVSYQSGLPKNFIGDEGRIRQVITNLISNAIKFTESGHVAIKVEGLDVSDPDKTKLKIEIEDTGIGITQAQSEKIFEGFTQAEGSTTRRFGGTGLGLTISRQLVEAMGGKIRVESEIGQGSKFWIELELPRVKIEGGSSENMSDKRRDEASSNAVMPIGITASKTARSKRNEVTKVERKIKALIVDPSDSSLKRLRKVCHTHNMDVMCQKSASNTISTLRNAYEAGIAFDVVVLNYHLSGTNGAEIAKSIFQDKSVGDLNVILMSKMDITHYAPRLRKIGISTVLKKPIEQSQLVEAILSGKTNKNVSALKSIQHTSLADAAERLSSNTNNIHKREDQTLIQAKTCEVERQLRQSKGRCSVLIVDDNRTNRVVLSSFVDTDLYDVETAEDGKEAWKMSKKTRYDMIFMDISMPVMDGVKATMLIRDDESNPNYETPIIACTAHALKGDRSRFTSVGMNDYISKPIQKAALDKIMQELIKAKDKAA